MPQNRIDYYEKIATDNKIAFDQKANESRNLANKIFLDLSKLGIQLNTFLFLFTATFLSITKPPFNSDIILLLRLAWISSIVSVIFGWVSLYQGHQYFGKISDESGKVARIWSKVIAYRPEIERAEQESEKIIEDMNYLASERAFIIEWIFFLISFLLISFAANKLLLIIN